MEYYEVQAEGANVSLVGIIQRKVQVQIFTRKLCPCLPITGSSGSLALPEPITSSKLRLNCSARRENEVESKDASMGSKRD